MTRGEVYFAALDPTVGSEQKGLRPVLVLQANALNGILSTVVVAPFTSNTKRAQLPTCVLVAKGEGGLAVDSVLLVHQMRVLDVQRLRGSASGAVSAATLGLVEKRIAYVLGL